MAQNNQNDQASSLRNKVASNNEPQLPSRIDTHRGKKGKTRWKVPFSLLRLIIIFVIVLLLLWWVM